MLAPRSVGKPKRDLLVLDGGRNRWDEMAKGRRVLLRSFAFLLVVAIALGASVNARADSSLNGRYFMVVWGYQAKDNDAVKSHTFASFYSGDDLGNEAITSRWLKL